jgi:hypothetical protein
MTDYQDFLAKKAAVVEPCGLTSIPPLPSILKPFQRDIVAWALRRGRSAIFAGTGLGKTLMQLTWARVVADHAKGRVSLLAPLAVAQQTVVEARKFGIASVEYASEQWDASSDIVVTEYPPRAQLWSRVAFGRLDVEMRVVHHIA